MTDHITNSQIFAKLELQDAVRDTQHEAISHRLAKINGTLQAHDDDIDSLQISQATVQTWIKIVGGIMATLATAGLGVALSILI